MAFARMMMVLGAGVGLAVAAGSMVGSGNGTERVPAAETAPPPPMVPGTLVSGQARVLAGDLLEIGGRRVRLFGIDAPAPEQSCTRDGQTYPCGQRAAEALAGRTRGKPVHCTVRRDDGAGGVSAVCQANGVDLAAEIIADGWAVARPDDTDAYVPEENRASDDHRGLWGGEFLSPADWDKKH